MDISSSVRPRTTLATCSIRCSRSTGWDCDNIRARFTASAGGWRGGEGEGQWLVGCAAHPALPVSPPNQTGSCLGLSTAPTPHLLLLCRQCLCFPSTHACDKMAGLGKGVGWAQMKRGCTRSAVSIGEKLYSGGGAVPPSYRTLPPHHKLHKRKSLYPPKSRTFPAKGVTCANVTQLIRARVSAVIYQWAGSVTKSPDANEPCLFV